MPLALILFGVAALAGFVDAVAGGGGLLTVPALLLAGLPPQLALGTNKGQSVFGSGAALRQFWAAPGALLDRPRAWLSLGPALVGAALGVALLARVSPRFLAPLVMVLLATAAVLMLVQRPPAHSAAPRSRSWVLTVATAFLIAGYDGFFGPGTGTFLILAYAYLWRDPLDAASANAKVVNFASNLASFVCFAWQGAIVWHLALPMAAGQLVGGTLGAHMTIRRGRALVRWMVVGVSLALLVRLAWQIAH
jgi:uncharacterized protein